MTRREVIRAQFSQFLGEAEYRRFLKAGVVPKVRYWQERAMARFEETHSELGLMPGELQASLQVCEVHDEELREVTVPGVAAELDYIGGAEAQARFPHALNSPVGLGTGAQEHSVQVWYCAGCDRSRDNWARERATKGASRHGAI